MIKQENIQTIVLNALKCHANYKDENEPESSEEAYNGRKVRGEDTW